MSIDDDLVVMVVKKSNKMLAMLQRVANELNDPFSTDWCDCPLEDKALIESLCKDVEKLLEEM